MTDRGTPPPYEPPGLRSASEFRTPLGSSPRSLRGVRSPRQNAVLDLPAPRHPARHDSCRLLVADRLTQGGQAMTAPNDSGAHTQVENQGGVVAPPRAQLDVTPPPQVIPARVDRDWALVEALRRRDSAAAERLLETFGDRVYRLALRITGNDQDAEEVVQDAFWSVLRHIDTFRGESLLGSWIYRITANTAYQKLRRAAHRRDEISLDQVLPVLGDGHHHGDWSAQIDDPAIQSELRAVLASAIDELPANHRAVFALHDVEGLSMAEVTDALGISLATAKTTAHRARLRLRKRLGMFLSPTASSVDVPA